MLWPESRGASAQPRTVQLVFSFVHAYKPPRTAGPFRSVWIDHVAMRDHHGGPVIAVNRDTGWEFESQRFHRVEITATGPMKVRFESEHRARSRAVYCFERFSLVDGLAYSDEKAIAHLGKDGKWFCYDFGERWPFLVIADVLHE